MEDTQNKLLENEENKLMKEIIERREKTKEKQQKIIDSLNQIGQMLFFDFYNPIKIFEPDYYITFELAKSCHQILLEYLIDKPYSIEYLCLMIFDILFFDLDDFNYENLDDKIESFGITLCTIKTRNFDQKAQDLLKAYLAKNNIFYELFFLFTKNFNQGLIGFLCLNVLDYCHDITKFVHFFIKCLHNTFEVKEDFSNDDIKNLTIEKFILKFIEIVKKEKNIKTISLSIIDSKISYKISYKINTPGTGKHNNNGSNKESTDDTSNNNLTKNNIKISEKISNLEEQEKEEENTIEQQKEEKNSIEQQKIEKNAIEQEKESEDSSTINNTTKKKRKKRKNKKNKKIEKEIQQTKKDEIKEEEKKQEKKKEIKEEQKEEKDEENPILNKISFVNVENEKLDNKNEDMAKTIKTLTEDVNLLKLSLENEKKSQTEKITNLANQLDQTKNELEGTKSELEGTKSELEETKKKLQKNTQELNKTKQKLKSYSLEKTETKNVLKSNAIKINGLNLKVSSNLNTINSLKNELIRIKDDLKLVQSREGFKALIDYFYHGLNFGESTSYKNKIILICTKLKQSKMKNNIVKYQIINFLKEILERLNSGNLTAHKFDLNKNVIEQIFSFVNKNNFRDIFNKIKTSNADIIIKELITKRDEFFYDKNKLEENEAEIYGKIPKLESTIFN